MIAETELSPCRTARSALTFSDHGFGQSRCPRRSPAAAEPESATGAEQCTAETKTAKTPLGEQLVLLNSATRKSLKVLG